MTTHHLTFPSTGPRLPYPFAAPPPRQPQFRPVAPRPPRPGRAPDITPRSTSRPDHVLAVRAGDDVLRGRHPRRRTRCPRCDPPGMEPVERVGECRRPGRPSIGDSPCPAPPGAGPRRSKGAASFHSSSGSRPHPGRDESGIADPLDYCVPTPPDRRYPTPSPAATFPAISRPPQPGRAPAATPRSPSSPRPRPPGPTPKPSPSPALDRPRVGEGPTLWSPSDADSIHRKLTAYGELRRDLTGMGQFKSGTAQHETRGSNWPIPRPGRAAGPNRGWGCRILHDRDGRRGGRWPLLRCRSPLARGAHAIVAGHHARPGGGRKPQLGSRSSAAAMSSPWSSCRETPCPAPARARRLGRAGSFPARPPTRSADRPTPSPARRRPKGSLPGGRCG